MPRTVNLILITLLCSNALSQIRFRPEDAVTFTDFRGVLSVEYSPNEIFFSSTEGIWRIDRFTGQPLDPWVWGRTLESPMNLDDGRLMLWHDGSSTLWMVSKHGLIYYHWGAERWYRFSGVPTSRIRAFGETPRYVYINIGTATLPYIRIDPYSFQIVDRSADEPEGVEWREYVEIKEFPYFRMDDPYLQFDPGDGSILDWELNLFEPGFTLNDPRYHRIYICYPDLGIGIGDGRHIRLDMIQPGPAGKDVAVLALSTGGFIWVGGENYEEHSGINLFDRATGRWDKFDSDLNFGMDSHIVRDIALYKNNVYFATPDGLLQFKVLSDHWTTYDRFDGLIGPDLRALGVANGTLVAGGDWGVNLITLPAGPIFRAGDDRLDDMRTADIVTDGDTTWVGGLAGVFRLEPSGRWTRISGEETMVGDEAVRCLAITRERLFIGGRRGVRELNRRRGDWKSYLGSAYLNNGLSKALAANDSLLWVGTDRGLYTLHLRKGSWLKYGKDEGLPSMRIQELKLEADTLWIGSPEGLTRFLWNRPERDVF